MTGQATCLTHRTTAGDRWDLLALRYYGEPLHLGPLLRANPRHAAKATLEEGLTLLIPIIQRSELMPDLPSGVEWR